MSGKTGLTKKLHNGRTVFGTWNTLGSVGVTACLGTTGLDFQILDLEHGPFVIDQIHRHAAASGRACPLLVRVPENSEWMVLHSLDQGAAGIVMPHVRSREDAERFIDAAKYRPLGRRGYSPYTPAGQFGRVTAREYTAASNENLISVVIVESRYGIERIGEIASTPGVDVVYFGAYDLSEEAGRPGQTSHPSVSDVIRDAVQEVRSAGKVAGGYVPKTADGVEWVLRQGINFVTYHVDSALLREGYENMLKEIAQL